MEAGWLHGVERHDEAVGRHNCASHYRATDATEGNPLHQQAFNQGPCVIRDEILFEALDELASAVLALMVLFTVVNVAIFLVLGRLTPWTQVSGDHRVLLTSAGMGSVLGQQ